jgi:hypothetical protein
MWDLRQSLPNRHFSNWFCVLAPPGRPSIASQGLFRAVIREPRSGIHKFIWPIARRSSPEGQVVELSTCLKYIYNIYIYISLWTKKTHPRWTFAKEQIISEVNIGNACCRPNGKTIHFGNHYVPLSPSLSQGVQRLRVAKSLHFVFWCLSYSNISSILL